MITDQDTYVTPKNIKQALRELLLFKTRWSPYSFFIASTINASILARKGKYTDEVWQDDCIDLLHKLERCGANFNISGIDNIKKINQPCVFIANHMSTLETFILPGFINAIRPCTFVVKQKLVKGPVWGPIMRSRTPIVVTRTDPRKDLEAVLNGGVELLAKGRSVIIFPQGTRRDNFSRDSFNSLGIKLAVRANVPVVPIALKTDYWGNSPVLRGFGPVRRSKPIMIEFGSAINISGKGKAEHEAVLNFIESKLRLWGVDIVDHD